VTSLPSRTTIVTPIEIAELANYIAALDLIQRAVIRLAALNHTAGELQRTARANDRYLEAIAKGDFQGVADRDKAFHLEIAQAAHNPYFCSYYEWLLGEGQRLSHLHFGL